MADPLGPVNHIDHLMYMMGQIDDLHYSYLYAHENLLKLDEKSRLEGHIREYLLLAPHEKKFLYPETSHILHKSAEFKENFNGIRASAAWTAIAAYAHNLLAQPWRREFREIKTYSGFYKHNIENGLVGSELMLALMGYRDTGNGTFTLEGPVDPDKVAFVSRDSLVALVECQILCSLYAELLKSGCHYSWLDILVYRESHVCNVEQALNGLMYQSYYNSSRLDCYPKCNVIERPYKPFHSRTQSSLPLPYYDTTDSLSMAAPCHIGNSLCKCTTSHKNCPSSPHLRQSNTCSVPTGQLIELDVSYQGKENYAYDLDQKKPISDRPEAHSSSLNTNDNNSNFVRTKFNTDASWDTWGATYPLHESKSNSKYDIKLEQREKLCNDWEEALKVLRIDDSQPSCSTAEPKSFEKPVDKGPKKKKSDTTNILTSSSHSLNRDLSKKTDYNCMSLKVKLNEKWECPTCTYHNTSDKDVCEMCSKSKVLGNEVQPLVSGGRQCPKCTLVNEKGVTTCDACQYDLKDSPTYI